MARGALCISIDLELAWGIWDKPSRTAFALCAQKERVIVARLLELFDRHDVGATWAVVGRLLENMEPPPVASEHGERIWYAPDLIEAIQRSPHQEIGSHSYAHSYFGETQRGALRDDVRAAKAIHDRFGLPFGSFVFPRNQVAQVDLLADAGVRVFRSVDVGWHTTVRDRAGKLPGRAANLADKILPIPPATVRVVRDASGMAELPSSMLLLAREGMRRLVHPKAAALKAKLGLRRAARAGGIFHLWFHPSNFYQDTEVQLGVLDDVLAAAGWLRARGELDVRTMGACAAA